jgi:hypothetical protein
MSRVLNYVPRVAIFLAGVAAGALTSSRRERGGITSAAAQDLKHSVANLESRLAAQESANTDRFGRIEARLDEHASKLADVPTLSPRL